MNPLKKFLNSFSNVRKKAVTFFRSNLAMGFNALEPYENFYDFYNLNTFKDSLYLFIGVSMIRESVSSIPLEMYKIINKQGETEEIFSSPILDILERPNKVQTQKEFWKLAVSYYLLAGETFWYLERENEKQVPLSIINMRPDSVRILLSVNQKDVIGYEFIQSDGTALSLGLHEVLHIKNIDPINPIRGIGVVKPATSRIITEKQASQHQANTFKNQGRPDFAVMTDRDLDEDATREAREQWTKIYGGGQGSQAGFFGEDVKDIKILSNFAPKDMDFINSQKFLREDILASLRIPIEMIKSEVNYANSQTARINYIKEAVMPVLDVFLDVINSKFLYDLDQDTFLTYDTPVNEDREILLKEAVELKRAGIITQNEARSIMNYPETDEGDNFDQVGGLFQLQMKQKSITKKALTFLKKRPVLIAKLNAIEAMTDLIRVEKSLNDLTRYQSPVFNTPELKEKYAKAFNKNIDKKSEIFIDTIEVYNQGLMNRIFTQQEQVGVLPDNIFNVAEEITIAKNIFIPLMKSIFTKAGQDTLDTVANGFEVKNAENFYAMEILMQAIEQRGEFFITSMLDTDFKELQKIIIEGLNDGKSIEQIQRDLRGYFSDFSVSRARTIARTETGRLISQATDEAYRQSAVVTGKQWITSRDAKVRDEHRMNDGQVVSPGGTFRNGERYPGELTINCRCVLAPAV